MKTLNPQRWLKTILLMAAALVIVMCVAELIGPVFTSPTHLFSGPNDAGENILMNRLQRVLVAAMVGAALAMCGAVFQGILRNPLADPFILGISGGGTVGAVLAVATGAEAVVFGFSTRTAFAFAGSLGALVLVLAFSRIRGTVATHNLILAGVVLNAIFSAIILFFMSIMSVSEMNNIYRWLMGSLYHAYDWNFVQIGVGAAMITACALILLTLAKSLNLFALGEETAVQMGVRAGTMRFACLILTAILAGVAVSIAGPIGFVGLIVPHIMRLIVGPDHRMLLPASFFGGAIFLLIADTLARSIMPLTHPSIVELPVGVVTALCGGPFFLWLLRARSRLAIFGK